MLADQTIRVGDLQKKQFAHSHSRRRSNSKANDEYGLSRHHSKEAREELNLPMISQNHEDKPMRMSSMANAMALMNMSERP